MHANVENNDLSPSADRQNEHAMRYEANMCGRGGILPPYEDERWFGFNCLKVYF
jgi:hypothetical protein